MVWVKICGITNVEDAIKISCLGADSLGFILSAKSPRKIDSGVAREIINAVKSRFTSLGKKPCPSFTGVFVNEKIDKVIDIYSNTGLDMIQLSGDESPSYINKLKKIISNAVIIKAIHIRNDCLLDLKEIIKSMEKFCSADIFLLDSYQSGSYGGTGTCFDWNIIKNLNRTYPLILAGGLNNLNVANAIDSARPFGVDASSGLESYPGKKDLKKVEEFIKNTLKKAE